MINNKNILFVFNFGSELRQFVYSGLFNELFKEGNKIFVSTKYSDSDFITNLPVFVEVIPYYPDRKSYLFALLNLALSDYDTSKFKFSRFNQDKTTFKKRAFVVAYNIILKLLTVRVFKKIIKKLEKVMAYYATSSEWRELLSKHSISKVICNVPNMNLLCLNEARKLNIERIIFFHTNKDIEAVSRFVVPYNKYGVWNMLMKKYLIGKFNINESYIHITGCLHFAYFMDDFPIHEIKSDINIGFDDDKEYITYICGATNFINEINLFDNFIRIAWEVLGSDYKIIIRKNPMETRDIWEKYNSDRIIVHTPQWYFSKENNFNYTLPQDLLEFIEILRRSQAVFGLPSTAVVEAAISNKMFYSLLFNQEVTSINTNSDANSLWWLPFYANVREFRAASPIYNESDLRTTLYKLKEAKGSKEKIKKIDYIKSELTYLNYRDMISKHISVIRV